MRVSFQELKKAKDFKTVGEETFGYSEVFGNPHTPHQWSYPKNIYAFGTMWVGNTARYSFGTIEYWSPSGIPNKKFKEVEDGFFEVS